jgi:hypothetical protein
MGRLGAVIKLEGAFAKCICGLGKCTHLLHTRGTTGIAQFGRRF